MIRRYPLAGLFVIFSGFLAGCSASPPPLKVSASSQQYLLGPGDKLHITVFNNVSLTGDFNVTASGTVAFPLIGSVPAEGKTIEQVSDEITSALGKGFVNDPSVSVEVLDYRPFYVLGEVNKPGDYPFVNGLTLSQAIATAGGFTYRANKTKVFLERKGVSGERSVQLREGPFAVMPGDTIRVGERYF